ncbi:hypothetical protein B0T17DRAFT_482531 [Bombardia bombarda]|uniref:Protein DOM34 homolog n=1 Tax=Bombardia bombarda TaxID=252184 RepID=A0AA39XNT4_9PEZI|nr:hypothetical protein B0T17DRAFT_482531 [Bombardia bombarda]
MRFVSKKQTIRAIDAEAGVALLPTDPEDMWHANNLIAIDDVIRAPAVRKVTQTSSTGSTISERVHTDLTIKVKSTSFDPAASTLQVLGTVIVENSFVAVGQHHTLDLELDRPFTIWKSFGWDSVALQQLQEALNGDNEDAVVAVVMQDGLANICLISEFRTVVKQRVEVVIPKKRSTAKEMASGMTSFYEKTLAELLNAVDFTNPRTLLLAGPGFYAQDFRTFMQSEGARREDKRLQRVAREAVVVHASTGEVNSLNQVLKSPQVQATMLDKRFARETVLMDKIEAMVRANNGRAWYGASPVEKAVQEGAVGKGGGILLVNNAFFRSLDIPTRKRYVALVDKVKQDGGEAKILSSDHASGKRLDCLGGIAAILTYPMHDLDDDDDDEGGDDNGEMGAGFEF